MLLKNPGFSEQDPACQLFQAYPAGGLDFAAQFFHLAPEHQTNATQWRCFQLFSVELYQR